MSSLLSDLLVRSATFYPDTNAIKYKGEALSYKQLDFLTSCLAEYLLHKGIGANSRVGIYIDKSVDAIVSIFGILKAGACYVPLDPVSPVNRQSFIISDCKLKHLIISYKKIPQIIQILKQENFIEHIFIIDANRKEYYKSVGGVKFIFKEEIFNFKKQNLITKKTAALSSDLAYILYTSGSTGKPKGIMVSHGSSLSFVNWAQSYFKVSNGMVVSAHAPFNFDLSIFDIFVTIKSGATISIVPQGLSAFPNSLLEFISNEKINIWYSVPYILVQLVLYSDFKQVNLLALKHIIFAGEVFPLKYLNKLMEAVPTANYHNLYGPTETNVITSHSFRYVSRLDRSLPIGKPCANNDIFIVDSEGKVVKDGEIGELYVSGPTLMDGYWDDQQKTDGAIVTVPFFINNNAKFYKTGDLVSMDNAGNIFYHGRSDKMIKSRGYRIEVGEIEAALMEHCKIVEAAVVGISDAEIGKRIKAFIVLRQDSQMLEKEVKSFCSKRIPGYMVPESVVQVKSLPKTLTGKIDQKSLGG